MKKSSELLILIAASLYLLSGCTTLNKNNTKKDEYVDVYLIADKDINQDVLGVPSPLKLNFLQLASEIEFRQMAQMNTEGIPYTEFLGKSVLNETSVMIRPNQLLDFQLPLNNEMRHLGMVANYRDDNSIWKKSLIPQKQPWHQLKKTNFLYLQITANNIVQLPEMEALEKILAIKLQEQNIDLEELTEEHKNKLLTQIQKHIKNQQQSDPSKGYFLEQKITPFDISFTKDNAPANKEPAPTEAEASYNETP